jgi:hypothetical protein
MGLASCDLDLANFHPHGTSAGKEKNLAFSKITLAFPQKPAILGDMSLSAAISPWSRCPVKQEKPVKSDVFS